MADAPRPLDASLDPSAPQDGAESASRYQVTARKYRPQTFGEMVGQEHVARTLQNAIRLDRLAHAYLFSGPRGVGKTTAARILAKAVNCTTPLKERDGAEPCRTCDSCKGFEDGRSMNIIEIDAASNNKVDDIRELRDTVRVPPQGAKKKIYILDEVHMLSQGAFNALLKTLEEPPPYVLFIFATTEPHKVLPTILSRTQRFDFRRIAVPEIVGRLQEICTEEAVEAQDEALMLIARKGDGALRDALSLFDQAVSLVGTPLNAEALRDALGVVDIDLFFETTDRAQAQDRAGLLDVVDRLIRRGYDLPEFLGGLAEHIRHLLVAASTGSTDLIEATTAMRERYFDAAQSWAEADLLHLLMLVDDAEMGIKASRQPRLTTELALLKMASLTPAVDIARLLAKLDRVEAALAGKELPPLPDGPASPPTAPAPTKPTPKATAEPDTAYSAPAPTAAPAPEPQQAAPPSGASAPSPAPVPPSGDDASSAPPWDQAEATSTPTASVPVLPTPAPPVQEGPTHAPETPSASFQDGPPDPAPPPAEDEFDTVPTVRAQTPPAPTSAPAITLQEGPPPSPQDGPANSSPDGPVQALTTRKRRDDEGGEPYVFSPEPPPPPTGDDATPEPPSPAAPPPLAQSLFSAPALVRRKPSGDGANGNPSASLPSGDGADVGTALPVVTDDFGVPLARVRELWPRLVAAVKAERVHVGSLLQLAQPHRATKGAVEVSVPDDFGRTLLESEAPAVTAALGTLMGEAPPALRFVVARPETPGETAAEVDPFERLKQLRQEHPVFRALFEKFGAEIVW